MRKRMQRVSMLLALATLAVPFGANAQGNDAYNAHAVFAMTNAADPESATWAEPVLMLT